MTSQEVINLGEQIVEPVHQNYFNSNFFLVALVVGLITLIILLFLKVHFNVVIQATLLLTSVSFVITFFFFMSTNTYTEDYVKHRKEVANWQEEVAYPYIKSLPYLERELDTVILNTTEMKNGTYIDKLPLIISYIENSKTITTSGVYSIEKSLVDGKKPYLKYKHLNTELGHSIIKGDYVEKIILPKNFKLEPSSN